MSGKLLVLIKLIAFQDKMIVYLNIKTVSLETVHFFASRRDCRVRRALMISPLRTLRPLRDTLF